MECLVSASEDPRGKQAHPGEGHETERDLHQSNRNLSAVLRPVACSPPIGGQGSVALDQALFEAVTRQLDARGIAMRTGTLVNLPMFEFFDCLFEFMLSAALLLSRMREIILGLPDIVEGLVDRRIVRRTLSVLRDGYPLDLTS